MDHGTKATQFSPGVRMSAAPCGDARNLHADRQDGEQRRRVSVACQLHLEPLAARGRSGGRGLFAT